MLVNPTSKSAIELQSVTANMAYVSSVVGPPLALDLVFCSLYCRSSLASCLVLASIWITTLGLLF